MSPAQSNPLSAEARRELLAIARAALAAAVRGEPAPPVAGRSPELAAPCGCFVTYKNGGRLRGCIGCFTSDRPLAETVAEYARISATQDWRFAGDPITPAELDDIDVEISVLSPLVPIGNPLDLELGVHGIYIRRGGRSGCFLPQVATEHGMSKEQFLSECCAGKAGLAPDAWRDPKTSVSVFTAEIVEEPRETRPR
ncbi:MAG TPA: AmmeMemoRadiSam system protein A [Planctomycetota bacterium]|nr:AmmeMemoRadiSam system protein A [Planctomycetota bacterium]